MPVELVDTKISPDILDTIGRTFKFRHAPGVAEWLKNALDNYLRLRAADIESRPGMWPVILNLIDGPSRHGPNLAVIDFGGTTYEAIDEFFLLWGSHAAASLGKKVGEVALTGGHGNGGKFYMRQMWKNGARFLTYLDGVATSLVVERRDDGKTGYWEFKDQPRTWREALETALNPSEHLGGAAPVIQFLTNSDPALLADLEEGRRGFTVVVGRRAEQVLSTNDFVRGGKWDRQKLVDAIRDAPQARRPIRELSISVLANGLPVLERLIPESIEDDPEWNQIEVDLPGSVVGSPVDDAGNLRLKKAATPLTGRLKDRNVVTILDAQGNPIATYGVRDLPIPGHSPVMDFLYAELDLDFDGVQDLIQNEREHLVAGPVTNNILEWLSDQIWERVKGLEESQKQTAERKELELAALLNDALNRHAKRFLEELQTQILVDLIDDPTGGGPGPVGGDGTANNGKGTGGDGAGGTKEVPGSEQKARRPRFPQILLSNFDPDPATGGSETKNLTDRHPPLEQDDTDKVHNVWWINTQHVFAQQAMKRGGAKGLAFRSYQLHMFKDVVQREALRYRQRREAELSLDRVENELTEMSNKFLGELPYQLVQELLD